MKNKEKYAEDIIDIACDGEDIAVDKRTGKVSSCNYISCSNCLFYKIGCLKGRKKWAESEYVEKPVISKRDRAFLDYLGEEYKFIARDDSGELCTYLSAPIKRLDCACWDVDNGYKSLIGLEIDFPMIKWEDDKPWIIEDLKKLEVVEEYG